MFGIPAASRLDLGEASDDKGVVLFDLTPEGLAAEPRVLPLEATPIYDVVVRSPQTDIPDLQKRYPDANRDLVRAGRDLHCRCR